MNDVLACVEAHRIVPVVVLHDATRASAVARALKDGGLPVAEVTFRTSAASAALAEMASDREMLVGAGTVVSPSQVDVAVAAGARFIVSPGLSRAVVRHCADVGVPVVPGVATATELMAALEEGIDVVKFFPAESCGGAAGIRALAAAFPQVRFVPTGGLTQANFRTYLDLPAVAAVGGSWMVPTDALSDGDFARVTALTRDAVAVAQRGES